MSDGKVRQVAGGLIWTYAERITAQLITMLVTVILARLISPDEYGIIAIVNIFINIANSFVINGFGNALIQKKDTDDADFSTVFYFSLALSVIIYLIVVFTAGIIADFYQMPELKLVIQVMAFRLPIAAINSIQQAYIAKRMEFRKFFFATLGGTIVSAIVGIAMAYMGFGIWALVTQYLTNVCIDTVVLSFTSGWRPRCKYSGKRMKKFFSFGWRVMFVGVMTTLYSSLRNFVIGKKYSSADLAYSEKGEQFPSAITGNICSSITKVIFPVLSENQNNIIELKKMVRRSIKISSYVVFPIMVGFCGIADHFVNVILTDKWAPCVPFLQIMCIVYALQPLQISTLQCIKALGKSRLYLWIDIIKKIVGILILVASVALFDDVQVVMLGALLTEIFSTIILLPINKRLIKYEYIEQVNDVAPAFFISAAMFICVKMVNFIHVNEILLLLFQLVVGIFTYILISIISKNECYSYILNMVKKIK